MSTRFTLARGIAALGAAAVVLTPVLVDASAASAPVAQQSRAGAGAQKKAQTLTVSTTKKKIEVKGTKGLRAGRVGLRVKGKGDGTVSVVALADGYSFDDLRKDFGKVDKGDVKALRRVVAKVDFLGGLGTGERGTITLPKAGDYTAFLFGDRGPTSPVSFRAGTVLRKPPVKVDGKVVAKTGARWGGADRLPAEGTLMLKNAATDSPHFLAMAQVVEGTTKDDVLEFLQNETPEEPPWVLEGELETDVVSEGRSMTIDYDLPPGQYVALCFFPDPKMGGMPHALMGMVKMLHLE
jgi:hypothetical protein